MTVLALAQIAIHDRQRYDRYVAAFMPVLTRHRGRLLAADESPRVVEGAWPYQKVILMAFDSREDFETSPDAPRPTVKCPPLSVTQRRQ